MLLCACLFMLGRLADDFIWLVAVVILVYILCVYK